MSELSSFYGGKTGASIVIAKRFDCISIPSNTVYTKEYYAIDKNNSNFILTNDPTIGNVKVGNSDNIYLIAKTSNNFKDDENYKWELHDNDGSQINNTSYTFPSKYAEGMVQFFAEGAKSSSEVNYGEYIIIDTIFGLKEYNNPDNGKIFRRGLDITTKLAGAEYIGQIVGPQGEAASLNMGTIAEVKEQDVYDVREYIPVDGDKENGIVPGKYTKNNNIFYNDSIGYGWATIKDVNGNITTSLIGFTFPYLTPEFISATRSAYYTEEDYTKGRITNPDLIGTIIKDSQGFDLLIENGLDAGGIPSEGETGHPFYRKWKITIPKGVKGDTQTNLEIYPTKVTDGCLIYSKVNKNTGALSGTTRIANNNVLKLDNYETTKLKGYAEVDGGGYVTLTDTRGLRMRYLETRYDNKDIGESEWIDIDEYNTITNVSLSEDGWLTVFYSFKDSETLTSPIRWIKYSGSGSDDGVKFNEDGTVTIVYNTKDPSTGQNEVETHPNLISWVTSTTLDRNGHYKVIYNNDNSYITKTGTEDNKAVYETDMTWPTQVTLNAEGVLKFLFNNNLINDIYANPWTGEGTVDRVEGSYQFIMPWLEKVKLLENGHFNFGFNNTYIKDHSDPSDYENWSSDGKTYQPRVTWITRVSLTDNGDLKVFFNNDMNKDATISAGEIWDSDTDGEYYRKHIKWITNVTISDDGIIQFIYNDGTSLSPLTTKIKYIQDIYIDTDGTGASAGEGQGDQLLHVVYNTKTNGKNDTVTVGKPINYIVEACVSQWNEMTSNTEANHLLVYYSDPAYRAQLALDYPDRIKRYQGTKDKAPKDGWFDLGDVHGEAGGIHIITNLISADQLEGKKPEDILHNPDHAGWVVTVGEPEGSHEIYAYDYATDIWYSVGTLDTNLITPDMVVVKSIPDSKYMPKPEDVSNLRIKGLWLAVDQAIFAE